MAELGPWYGDTMTISVALEGGASISVGKLQALEMRIEVNETEYFSADSTLRDAVAHSEKVPVVVFEIGSWDIELHKQWLGGSGTSSTGLVDTSDPQKYDITGTVTAVGGTNSWDVTVQGVTIPTLPLFTASRNEFLGEQFEGRGDDINIDQEPS